jgi:hypothetical protein
MDFQMKWSVKRQEWILLLVFKMGQPIVDADFQIKRHKN